MPHSPKGISSESSRNSPLVGAKSTKKQRGEARQGEVEAAASRHTLFVVLHAEADGRLRVRGQRRRREPRHLPERGEYPSREPSISADENWDEFDLMMDLRDNSR